MSWQPWEVIIIGGGPAGLSAALTLGRCRRRVLVLDAGRHRNRASRHLHCFPTREGIAPHELLQKARDELRTYSTVNLRKTTVIDVERTDEGFEVTMESGARERAPKLLIATGVVDELPPLRGIEPLYGISVHHCPYCDGWEWRDQPIAVFGNADKGAGLALMLKQWTSDIVLVTHGPGEIPDDTRSRLESHGIVIREERIDRLEGTADGYLDHIVFVNGDVLPRSALFFNTGQHQRSPLAARLGCDFTSKGGVETGDYDVATNIPGLYVAGDASRDVQLVLVAMSEGVKAAFAINKALLAEAGLSV